MSKPAVAVEIAEVHPHVAEGNPVPAEGDADGHRLVAEGAVAVVAVQVVLARVVGHEEVRPPVVVVVSPDGAHPVTASGSWTPACAETSSNVPSPRLWKRKSVSPDHAPRTALDGKPAVTAGLVLPELGQVVHVDVHVAGHEEVDVAVAIVVAPRPRPC